MFTPQRKGWRSAAEQNGSLPWKGKTVASAGEITPPPPPPPPRNSLAENGGGGGGSAREAEVWKRFRDAGMLSDANFDKKDHEALLQKISKLEEELYNYQYNMGLLLLEQKEWTSKYEELQQGLIDAEEILKREQSAHLAAISEVEKREENLKKALGVEKQCVTDLEVALRELRAKNSEMKFTSEGKLADANALIANIEDKSLEAAAKNSAADARLSELNRKSSEIERKLQDLTVRESMLQKERASLNIDKELHLKELSRKRDELLVWETSLREGQERLVESQELLNQRERRSNESDMTVKKKEKELDALRVEIERTFTSLKEREDYINLRLTALSDKEKEAGRMKESLEYKEKELAALEDALTEREQKVTQEHNLVLDAKKREFDKDMETKQKIFEEERQRKLVSVEKREREISHREEELTERKRTLEKLITESNGAKMDLETRSKSLKEREENLRIQNLELEKKTKQFAGDEEELAILKAKLEVEWKSLKSDKAGILKQLKNLEISEEERLQHNKLQSKLAEEIEECRILKNLITKEREDLRQDRENFEREWEVLDEKRNSLSSETKRINAEEERLEKWKHNEEERLENELLATRNSINREMDELKLRKEAFKGKMELERSEILEKLQQEREDMARELENKKHELQIETQKKLEESEHRFKLEVADFNRMRETELAHINSLRNSASLDRQKMKCERDMFEREKLEYINQRKKIEEAQLEIRNDIESLRSLSRNLKNQREEFLREREHFLALVEKYKITLPELAIPLFQSQCEVEDPEKALLPSLAGGFMVDEFNSGMMEQSPVDNLQQPVTSSGRLSWLRSCTKKMFGFSPVKKNEESSVEKSDQPASLDRVESEEVSRDLVDNQRAGSDDQTRLTEASERNDKPEEMPCPSAGVEDNSTHIDGEALDDGFGDREEPDDQTRPKEASGKNDKLEGMPSPSAGVEDDSVHIHGAALENGFGGRDEPAIAPVGILMEAPILSEVPKGTPEPEPRKKGRGRYAKGKHVKRTKSVKAVVEESKSIHGKDGSEEIKDLHLKINEGQEDTSQTELMVSGLEHKRRFAQTLESTATERDADIGAQSESISVGGRRKRRQVAASPAQEAGDRRYNLRRSTVAGGRTKGPQSKARSQSSAATLSNASAGEIKGAIESGQHSSQVVAEGGGAKEIHVVERIAAESTVEVNEFSLEKVDKVVGDEEVNGTEAATTSAAIEDGLASEDEYDSEGDSVEKSLNASIGKKIWNFLTS